MSAHLRTKVSPLCAALVAAATLCATRAADAGVVAQCGQPVCSSSFSIFLDGSAAEAGGGQLNYDAASGAITLDFENNIRGGGMVVRDSANNATGLMWDLGGGASVSVNGLSGNADPILGFGVGTTTGTAGTTVGFVFNLPIALAGTIQADAQVSYSLTALSAAGAQISPIGSRVVQAFEVDTSVGGLPALNKGVDVGETFFVLGGPVTTNSSTYSATNFFTGSTDYDLMRVQVNYALSPMSAVALSGFVQQVVVPLPAALPLLLAGLAGFGAFARRRATEASH